MGKREPIDQIWTLLWILGDHDGVVDISNSDPGELRYHKAHELFCNIVQVMTALIDNCNKCYG